jgi:L-ribulokinase
VYTIGIDYGTESGSAMHAAVAAGVYPDIQSAPRAMAKLRDEVVRPIVENVAVDNELYSEYKTLYHYFGRGQNDVMKRLKAIRHRRSGGLICC